MKSVLTLTPHMKNIILNKYFYEAKKFISVIKCFEDNSELRITHSELKITPNSSLFLVHSP